jgi:hypothetical protein
MLKDMILDSHSAFHKYFIINKTPNPNWFLHLFYGFILIFVPAFAAEKIFLILYVILFPISFRYLIRKINPENYFISLLIFPLIYNVTLYFGFFNFCISIIFYFYTVGYWIKYKGLFNFKKGLIFLILVTLTYFSHPVSFFMELLTFGFLFISFEYNSWKQNESFPNFKTRLSGLIQGFFPALFFFFIFLHKSNTEINWPEWDILQYINNIALNRSISYMGNTDTAMLLIFSVVLIFLTGYNLFKIIRHKGFIPLNILILQLIIFGILSYFAPDDFADGSFIFIRLVLFFNMFMIMCIAVYSYSDKWKHILSIAFTFYAIGFLGFRSYYFYQDNKTLDEYLSVSKYIPEGSTFLPFSFSNVHKLPDGSVRYGEVEPFLHASGYISIERNALSLENYEATFNYFPLEWRKKYYPADCFPEEGDNLKDSAFIQYANRSGIWPDFVLLWGEPDVISRNKFLLGEINKHYGLVKTSGKKYAWLYRRKVDLTTFRKLSNLKTFEPIPTPAFNR